MSIVSSTIEIGGGHGVETHTDHLGNQYTQCWLVPASWSQAQIDAKVAEHAAQIEARLAEAEFAELIEDAP